MHMGTGIFGFRRIRRVAARARPHTWIHGMRVLRRLHNAEMLSCGPGSDLQSRVYASSPGISMMRVHAANDP